MSTAAAVRTAGPAGPDFELVTALAIIPSPTNPRKHYDKAQLEELAESIKKHGILQPVLLRPWPKGRKAPAGYPSQRPTCFELVAGERRFRAAALAGLQNVPSLVRDMTDAEVLEIQLVENLQRSDLHPLEEAEGYRQLVAAKYDVARIAERVGRSPKYVYDRIKLLDLTKEAQQAFLEGEFTAGHAVILARLKPADQKRAMDTNERDGLFRTEGYLFTPEEEKARPGRFELREALQRARAAGLGRSTHEARGRGHRPGAVPGDGRRPPHRGPAGREGRPRHLQRDHARGDPERREGHPRPLVETRGRPARLEGLPPLRHRDGGHRARPRPGLQRLHQQEELRGPLGRPHQGREEAREGGREVGRQDGGGPRGDPPAAGEGRGGGAPAEDRRWKSRAEAPGCDRAARLEEAPAGADGAVGKLVLESFEDSCVGGRRRRPPGYLAHGRSAEDLVRNMALQLLLVDLESSTTGLR